MPYSRGKERLIRFRNEGETAARMGDDELCFLLAPRLSVDIRVRKVSPMQVVDAVVRRIMRVDAKLVVRSAIRRLVGDRREHRGAKTVIEDLDACSPKMRDLLVLQAVAEYRDRVAGRPRSQFLDEPFKAQASGGHLVQVDDERAAVAVRQAIDEASRPDKESVSGAKALDLSLNSVLLAKSRVLQRLRQELAGLVD
jgi:hypothetical protein